MTKRQRLFLNVMMLSFLTDTFVVSSSASADDRQPTYALLRQGGLAGALLGGGIAFNSDLSAVDGNPAGLGLVKDVSAGGEFFWRDKYATATEVGVVDSKMSDITAAFKARQTTGYTGGIDRRYTLGFAGRPVEAPLLVGLAGDYMQIKTPDTDGEDPKLDKTVTYKSLRFGGVYEVQPDLKVAVRSAGYFDIPQVLTHTIGAAMGFAQNYVGNIDLSVVDTTLRTAVFGITVLAKGYLDLSASYGYDLEERTSAGALGIVLKSNIMRLYYTGVKTNLRLSDIEHSVGARLSIEF